MKIYNLEQQILTLEQYLLVKLQQRDFHGVRDVCTDIEILEAVLKATKESK